MPDHDRRNPSIAEAAWHLTAAECRLMLAMREPGAEDAPGGSGPSGSVPLDRLIDDLGRALAQLSAALGEAAGSAPAPRADARNPAEPSPVAAFRNGSFTTGRHSGKR